MPTGWFRWAGPAMMLGGLLFVVVFFVENNFVFWLTPLALLLLVWGLVAIHVQHASGSRVLQTIGLLVTILGLAMFFLGGVLIGVIRLSAHHELIEDRVYTFGISPGFHLVLPIGLLLFGLAIMRVKVLPRWGRNLLLLMGAVGCLGIPTAILYWSGFDAVVLFLVVAVTGLPLLLGWMPLGYALWSSNNGKTLHPEATK